MTSRSQRRSRRRPIVPRPRRRRPDPAPFRVSVEHRARVALLHISGEFDLCGVSPVERALDRAVGGATDDVVFDLRGVSFLDCSGLGTILKADERAQTEPFTVHVVRPPGLAARIFTLTRSGETLAFVDAD